MRTGFVIRIAFAAALAAMAAAPACTGEAKKPANWRSGVGTSALVDPREAAAEAAAKAKEGLAGAPAKVVVVIAAEPQVVPALIEGVAEHFDTGIIYGCQVSSPLTFENNFPDFKDIDIPAGAAVWALAGDMDVTVASVRTDPEAEDTYFEAGLGLGETLRPALEATDKPGKLLVTFGDQYNGANKDYALGLNEGLGAIIPIVGAAAGNITSKVVVKGEIVTGVNVGILIADHFKVGMAMNGGTHTPETADKTLAEAVAEGAGAEPFFALVFNCRRRRQGMIERNQLAEELDSIRKRLPGVEFFGFYGPGEVGAKAFGKRSEGVGFTVVTAVLFAQ